MQQEKKKENTEQNAVKRIKPVGLGNGQIVRYFRADTGETIEPTPELIAQFDSMAGSSRQQETNLELHSILKWLDETTPRGPETQVIHRTRK